MRSILPSIVVSRCPLPTVAMVVAAAAAVAEADVQQSVIRAERDVAAVVIVSLAAGRRSAGSAPCPDRASRRCSACGTTKCAKRGRQPCCVYERNTRGSLREIRMKRHAEQALLAACRRRGPLMSMNSVLVAGLFAGKRAHDAALLDDEPARVVVRRLQHRDRRGERQVRVARQGDGVVGGRPIPGEARRVRRPRIQSRRLTTRRRWRWRCRWRRRSRRGRIARTRVLTTAARVQTDERQQQGRASRSAFQSTRIWSVVHGFPAGEMQ